MKTATPARMLLKRLNAPTAPTQTKIEQRAFDAQIREGLMQALEDSVCPFWLRLHVCHTPLLCARCNGWLRVVGRVYTPQSQLRTFTARTAMPVPAATPASAFFAPGSPCANCSRRSRWQSGWRPCATVPVKRICSAVNPVSKGEPLLCAKTASGKMSGRVATRIVGHQLQRRG